MNMLSRGTFNWNYAISVGSDEELEYWYDTINDTRHRIQKAKSSEETSTSNTEKQKKPIVG
jgi:hypothetical protein